LQLFKDHRGYTAGLSEITTLSIENSGALQSKNIAGFIDAFTGLFSLAQFALAWFSKNYFYVYVVTENITS